MRFKRITNYTAVEDEETMDYATSVQRYQLAVDDFIMLGVWGSQPKITEAPTPPSDNHLTMHAMTVTLSIPAGPCKGKKPTTCKSTPFLTLATTIIMQVY